MSRSQQVMHLDYRIALLPRSPVACRGCRSACAARSGRSRFRRPCAAHLHDIDAVVSRESLGMELRDRVFEVSHSLSRKEAELENAERRCGFSNYNCAQKTDF
jgi:hypothetical protein